ncbi:MAG: CocE/NonD family hydrolase [Cyanobacteria bacterium REEB67]|nr:CocE/NonD family hydrolase [Cyanobacteria bacterium REEB67]
MKTTKTSATTSKYHRFKIFERRLTMPDGVELAASIYLPLSKGRAECRSPQTFPLLLEYLPYRKDDTFYVVDHSCFSFFAQLGFIAVKVDIRGTGGSGGAVPDGEYSETEMHDCFSVVEQLAAHPACNGNVGMFGISWSGFNSLQMAMRRPPALKAIHAVHASDDMFNDDLHYIDSNLHLDPYHLFINHELGLPRTPDYELDEAYFRDRFEQRPWLFTYLNQQTDGKFWRRQSLREDYSRIGIPVYLMGGLLDGYRSATVRMYKNLDVPVRCDIGPWEHSCPDEGSPGPNFDWQIRLARWFEPHLRPSAKGTSAQRARAESVRDKNASGAAPRDSMVFVRAGHAPDLEIDSVPGYWLNDALPAAGTRRVKFVLAGGSLKRVGGALAAALLPSVDRLVYKPFAGTAAGAWWGNRCGDMSGDDAHSLTYDSAPLKQPLQIIGAPHVKLKVSSNSSKVKWTLRLEDVAPDGQVSLVTGVLYHPALARGNADRAITPLAGSSSVGTASTEASASRSWPAADSVYEIDASLHFTTWTFQPGHRLRLAIANAQFPMAWPSPEPAVSTVYCGSQSVDRDDSYDSNISGAVDGGSRHVDSFLSLPVVPLSRTREQRAAHPVRLPRVVPKLPSPDSEGIDFPGQPESRTFNSVNKKSGELSHTILANSAYRIRQRRFYVQTKNRWSTFDEEPWRSSYLGEASTTIVSPGRKLQLRTKIAVLSDRENFYVTVVRTIIRNSKVVRRRRFKETIARCFQ